MEKQDYIWVAIRIFGMYLLVEAIAYSTEPIQRNAVTQDSEINNAVAFWNSACDDAEAGHWSIVRAKTVPDEVELWDAPDQWVSGTVFLGVRINRSAIKIYNDDDGSILARAYVHRPLPRVYATDPRILVRNILLGSEIKRPGGAWKLRFARRDDNAFGLSLPINGIRLRVSPAQYTLKSWSDLRFTIILENVSKEKIKVRRSPSFYLTYNLAIALLGASDSARKDAYQTWYDSIEDLSQRRFSWTTNANLGIEALNPGDTQRIDLTLKDLCWASKKLPEGPPGKYELFIVYDANLENDPGVAGLDVWGERVASARFSVEVKER